jgi:2-dehydro-3-deoxyphosphogluconate aldolase/(4S)-4-hydroxy-2-oxoglutarate aldolase
VAGEAADSSTALDTIAARGLVAVVEVDSVEEIVPLVDALLEGGLDVAEITLRTDAALDALELALERFPEAVIGAGTVRTAADAQAVLDAGAAFVVSPGVVPDVVSTCTSRGVAALPGACTPTEIDAAVGLGARAVKFFPAEPMGGVSFLRALAGPFRDVSFVPTGGVDISNLAEYLRLPQVIACGGSWLVAPALVRERRFAEIRSRTRDAVTLIAQVREEASTHG